MVPPHDNAGTGSFVTTPWSLLFASRRSSQPTRAEEALGHLCEIYWRPIYSFIRTQGCDCYEAQDLTQRFLLHLIERDRFFQADPERGRFRSYVLGTLKLFLAGVRRDERARKRGGDAAIVPLEGDIVTDADGETTQRGPHHSPNPVDVE